MVKPNIISCSRYDVLIGLRNIGCRALFNICTNISMVIENAHFVLSKNMVARIDCTQQKNGFNEYFPFHFMAFILDT
jgi:hypothetical protein